MAYVLENNRGSIFKNKSKTEEQHPDYSGEINIEGKLYFIDSWIKEGQHSKYQSLRVKLKDKQPELSKEYENDI